MKYSHLCNWPGCSVPLLKNQWACNPHWLKLDPSLRIQLWQNFENPAAFVKLTLEIRQGLLSNKAPNHE